MATLTTLVDGQLAVVAPVNGNFAALNTEIVAAMRTGYASDAQITNVGTGTDTLHTWTMPANTLSAAGDGLIIRTSIFFDNNANAKTTALVLGSATPIVLNSTAAPNGRQLQVTLVATVTVAATGQFMVWGAPILCVTDGSSPAFERAINDVAWNPIAGSWPLPWSSSSPGRRRTPPTSFRPAR